MRRWRGLKALVHDAVDITTDVIGDAHEQVARKAMAVIELIEPIAAPARTIDELRRVSTQGVLSAVKLVNRAVEQLTDTGIDQIDEARGEGPSREETAVPMRSNGMREAAWLGDAALGAVNGVVGDYLHDRTNGLALGMQFRLHDRYLPDDPSFTEARRTALTHVGKTLVVFVHGLSTTEWSWCHNAEAYHGDPGVCFGTLLERDLGFTAIFVRYNTGRHISQSGRLLAEKLERLLDDLPAEPDEIVLMGHSMGGLVVRSACHYGKLEGHRWISHVKRVFCLGSPHQGAALEKLANVATTILSALDVPGTTIPAKIINARSAGTKDLRYGYVIDEEWLDRDPDALLENNRREVPLLNDVAYYFLSATMTHDPGHVVGHLMGDLLVRVPSASGPQLRETEFAIETANFGGVLHHELQNHPDVYAMILKILTPSTPTLPAPPASSAL